MPHCLDWVASPRGTFEKVRDRRLADLGVDLAIVLVFHPSLRRLVEDGECEIGDALQHGNESTFDGPPGTPLVWRFDTGCKEASSGACRASKDPPLRSSRSRCCSMPSAADHASAVRHVVLGVLSQIPVQMTGEPCAIVEQAKQNRPACFRGRHAEGIGCRLQRMLLRIEPG